MFETKKDYNETEMRTLIELFYGSVKFSSGLSAVSGRHFTLEGSWWDINLCGGQNKKVTSSFALTKLSQYSLANFVSSLKHSSLAKLWKSGVEV